MHSTVVTLKAPGEDVLPGPHFLVNVMKASKFGLIKSSVKTLSLTLPEALWSGFKALCKAFSQNHLV